MKRKVAFMLCFIVIATLVPVSSNALSKGGVQAKVVYDKPVVKTVSGYPGGQPKKGTRFSTGGGFYYGENGGPSISVSYKGVSVSVPLGQVKSSGVFVKAPSTKYYYKLYVTKKVKVKPYKTYLKKYDYSKKKYVWKYHTKGAIQSLESVKYTCKRVK